MEPVRIVNHIRSMPKTMEDKLLSKNDPYGSVATIIRHNEHKGLGDDELPDYHDKEVKRILRKVDYRLPTLLAVLYLLSFLDRSNSMLRRSALLLGWLLMGPQLAMPKSPA